MKLRLRLVMVATLCSGFHSVRMLIGGSAEALMESWRSFSSVTTADGLFSLCATDAPSSTESASRRLRCSSLCLLQPFCYHFNYFEASNQCELFYDTPPVSYSIVPECHGYQVQRSPRAITFAADEALVDAYADGIRLLVSASNTFYIPLSTQVLSIYITNTVGLGSLLASDDAGTLLTDDTWMVTADYNSGWMSLDFDDSGWERASVIAQNDNNAYYSHVEGINASAAWISTNYGIESDIYYRAHIRPR